MATKQIDVQGHIERAKAKRQWFVDLVRKYEAVAAQDPAGYRRKVRLFGSLGYIYVFGVLIFVIAFLAGMIALMFFTGHGNVFEVKILFVGAIIAFSIVKALFVKFDPPTSLLVTRSEAPRLYQEVDAIAEQLQAPKPEEIRIDPQLNAAAQQTPRLGIFGWYRNVLHLGMPLLLSLSPEEAKSVIAHELGHFSGQHGRFGAWTYRLGMTWSQLYENLHRHGGRGSWLFNGFINWFVPRFEAMSFALRRAQEYEADRAAAQVAGVSNASRALMKLPFLSSHLDAAFWDPFWDQTKDAAQPPAHAFAQMPLALRSAPSEGSVHDQLTRALQEPTDYDDTHPSLSDRLRAMKQSPSDIEEAAQHLAEPMPRSAGEEFFGRDLPLILDKLEMHYRPLIQRRWDEVHKEHLKYRKQIEEIEALAKERALTEDEEVSYALAISRSRKPEESEPVLRSLIDRYPQNASANYLMGELLIEQDDEAGVALVQQATRLEGAFGDPGRKLIAGFYYRRGEQERFEAVREEAFEAMAVSELVEQEAQRIDIKADYLAADFTNEEIDSLRSQLASIPSLDVAYAIRKSLPNGAFQTYLVVFPVKKFVESGKEGTELLEMLTGKVTYPRKVLLYTNTQQRKAWERMLATISGAKIYERQKPLRSSS